MDKKFDIVIFPSDGIGNDSMELWDKFPPVENRINIFSDVWIGKIEKERADEIMQACEPKGYNFNYRRQYYQLYSVVRELPPGGHTNRWDADQKLQFFMAFSRLIHPTSISFEYTATVKQNNKGEIQEIKPSYNYGLGCFAHIAAVKRDRPGRGFHLTI